MPFDFSAIRAPFRMQPGLRRLAAGATQLTPNLPGDRALREKLAVLMNYAHQALLVEPGFDAQPALQRLFAFAAVEHPQAWSIDATGAFAAHHLGWSLHGDELRGGGAPEISACLNALPAPWRAPALLSLAFAEDFAIIDASTGHIPWLAVCLPSHWAPEDKIGRHFTQVHAPVADNQLLLTASDHLARLVTGIEHWERFVWTITPEPRLHTHPKHTGGQGWRPEHSADELAAHAYFRTERQTFIPVPDQAQAVFTIHVQSWPLAAALAAPEHAASVHDALASMSPAVLQYRGLNDARDRLLQWLAPRASALRR